MKNLRYKLLAVFFGCFIGLPTLESWLGVTKAYENVENRPVGVFPAFSWQHPYDFLHNFRNYYPVNFGLRNFLLHSYSRLKYSVFHISPLPEKLILGQHNWLFLGNADNRVLDQHRGIASYPDDTLQQSIKRLIAIQQILSQRGIKLYLVVAPDAHTIYPEYLPNQLPIVPHRSSLDRFKHFLASQTTIPFIDLRKQLIAGKKSRPVYYNNDTHWNNWGALICTKALIGQIHNDMPEVPLSLDSDFVVRQAGVHQGDLAYMAALSDYFPQAPNFIIQPTGDRKVHALLNSLDAPPFAAHFQTTLNLPTRLLYFGDSFTTSVAPLLATYFQESFFRGKPQFDLTQVDSCKPTVVVMEMVERRLIW